MIVSSFSSIAVDARWNHVDGIGRFSREVLSRLPGARELRSPLRPLHPLDCLCWGLFAGTEARCLFSPGFNAPLFLRRPYVFTIHDLIHLDCPEEASLAKSLYYEFILKSAARRAFRVLTVSEFSKQRIVAWAGLVPERVVVVYNGVSQDFSTASPAHEPGYPYLLYVGNQKPHKNIPRMLAAVARTLVGTETRLIMTGQPQATTVAAIERWNLADRVVFRGRLTDAVLATYYRGAKLLLAPSLLEGFGLSVVEAMACGTPVVCANTGSLPEIAGGAACLVNPLDVEDIAEGIRRVLSDEGLAESLRRRGLRRAGAFNWDVAGAIVREVLTQAIV